MNTAIAKKVLSSLIAISAFTISNAQAEHSPIGKTTTLIALDMLTVDVRGLARRLSKKIAAAYPFSDEWMMFLNGEPERLRCVFDSDELARDVLYGERQIIVYPVKAFRNLYSKSEQLNEFDRRVNMLTKALNTRHYDHGEISLLPSIDAYQVIRAHVKFLNFHGGRGIRFISRYATDVSPTTGRNIFYTYQGLTNDGRYWVSVFYPLQASFKGTTNEALATRRLNALTDQQFKPALSNLDHMVMSIKITLPRESSVQH